MGLFCKKRESNVAGTNPVDAPPIRAAEIPDYAEEYKIGAVVIKPLSNGKYGLFEKALIFTPYFSSYYGLEKIAEEDFSTIEKARARYRHIQKKPILLTEEA